METFKILLLTSCTSIPVEQLDDIQVQRGYRIAGIYSIYRKPKVTYHSISAYR